MSKRRDARQFIVINEEKLIQEVNLRPILYDKALKGYRKPTIRENAWQEVANNLGSSVEESKKRWRSLRDAFMKQYKQSSVDDPCASKKKKWLFYDQMEFLGPFLELNFELKKEDNDPQGYEEYLDKDHEEKTDYMEKMCKGDIIKNSMVIAQAHAEEEEYEEQEEDISELYGEEHIIQEIFTTSDMTNNVEQRTQQPTLHAHVMQHTNSNTNTNNMNSVVEQTPVGLEDDPLKNTPGIDPDERFLLSCVPIMKRVTDKKNALARVKIQQILYEIEFGELGC